MPEVFTWMEGQAFIWTGISTVSALTAYLQNTTLNAQYGWLNRRLVTGRYQDLFTGRRFDLQVGGMYMPDGLIQKFANQTALVHVHLRHSSLGGTAGAFLWSGRIDGLQVVGSEANPYVFTLNYHSNIMSGYP